ncbi:unnamed protein product [Ectocarpus sp. 13 AM-2016]
MLGVAARRVAGAARPALRTARCFSTAEAPAVMKLNFCLPHETIYKDKDVDQVSAPRSHGKIGITAGMIPNGSKISSSTVRAAGQEPENFFVSAGFALTHPTSVTDITAIEAVRVEEIDEGAVKSSYDAAKREMDAATEGSREAAEAQVAVETTKAMAAAIGVVLAS